MPRCLFAALLFAPGFLFAQTTPEPKEKKIPVEETKAETKAAPETVKLEKVEVTGSRIRTLNGEVTAIPTVSIGKIELEQRGVTRLADVRWAIPQLGGTVGFNDNLSNGGTSRAQQVSTSFNLRGLGGNSTLVLVDGRRVPHSGQEAPGGAGGREDFNVDGIPVSAIERIDVLPQGAGAIYGSEAIAGVINIVLKKNYTGAELAVTYDNTFDSDVAQTTVSVTAGYRAGKLSTFLTASLENQNGLASRDRWFSATTDPRVFGGTNAAFFLSQPASGAGSLSSTSSPQNPGQANLPGLTTNIVGIPSSSNGTTAANSAYTTTYGTPFDSALYSILIDPAKRKSVVFKADYDYVRGFKPYVEARWSKYESDYVSTPLTLTFTSLPVGTVGNPFPSAVILRKVFYDLPLPETISAQENQGATVGFRGSFLENWRYDASASWARNIVSDDAIYGGFNLTLLNAGLTNANPALRPILAYDSSKVTDPNPAGRLADYRPTYDHKDTTTTYQYLFEADGPIWTGWAGDVQAAVGGEFDIEKVNFYRDPGNGLTFLLSKPFDRNVRAYFGEVTVPLLSEKQQIPFVNRLELGGAFRASYYSDVGSVSTPTYRALYQPLKWLSLRGSRTEGFKPVRLYDLLGPATNSLSNVTVASNVHDPLRGGEQLIGTNFPVVIGGNPRLTPEHSVSRNWGVVVDVPGRWFKGLSFSADHYEQEYTDRSGTPSLQVLLDFFPERITRALPSPTDPAGYAGVVTGWNQTNINLAGVRTRGWDYQMSYQRTYSIGNVSLLVGYTEPGKVITKSTPLASPSASRQPKRASASLFWNQGPWGAGVAVNYQDIYYVSGSLTSIPMPKYIEWNPQVSYDFKRNTSFDAPNTAWWQHAFAGSKFTLTVVNALNREPSNQDVVNGRIVMDPRLRRYIVSFTKKF